MTGLVRNFVGRLAQCRAERRLLLSDSPIFGFEAVDEGEDAVVGDQSKALRQRVRGDHHVFNAEREAFAFLMGAELAVVSSGGGVPWEDHSVVQEGFHRFASAERAWIPGNAVAQFSFCDC